MFEDRLPLIESTALRAPGGMSRIRAQLRVYLIRGLSL
jgi:hypothetical protein